MERPEFSEELASRRRQLGFSTTQASRVLRLKEEVLIAFEEGDFDAMPKSGYAQGMLSSYARYLGLDAARIVEMYAEELERWRREELRGRGPKLRNGQSSSRSTGVGQPYVAARGLLPTSGGPAGDMGSFATTRVRTRSGETYEAPNVYARTTGYDQQGSSTARNRPYTSRAPERRSRRRDGSERWDDIQTRGVRSREYEDDLRIGMDAESYQSASSRAGRRSSRNISGGNRQRVRSRSGSSSRSGGHGSARSRGRGSSQRRGSNARRNNNTQISMQALAIVAVAIVVISVILVVSISSYVNNNFNTSRTEVPVNTTSSVESSNNSSNASTSNASDSKSTANNASRSNETTTTETNSKRQSSRTSGATEVTVSVAEGAVTWLEIECDGKSEIAEQVTGPWEDEYAVEDSLSVQASDTSSVQVTQDGKPVQFDSSKASGIGTIRIQGNGTSRSSSKSSGKSTSKDSSSDLEQTEDEDEAIEEDEDVDEEDAMESAPSERTSGSKSSSGSSSAKMGNNAPTDDKSSTSRGSGEYDEDEYY